MPFNSNKVLIPGFKAVHSYFLRNQVFQKETNSYMSITKLPTSQAILGTKEGTLTILETTIRHLKPILITTEVK